MLIKLILLQLIAHLLGDYFFQPHRWVEEKKKHTITWFHFWHVIVIFIFSYLLSLDYGFLLPAILLTLTHLITDSGKSYFENKNKHNEGIFFFIDQSIHLVFIITISVLYSHFNGVNFLYDIELRYIAIAFGFILCCKPTNIIIKNILLCFNIDTYDGCKENEKLKKNDNLFKAGRVIGTTERFIILALVLIGQYGAVGLVITAKSILRFKNNGKRNEYILVGTMLSVGIAVIIGICINKLPNF